MKPLWYNKFWGAEAASRTVAVRGVRSASLHSVTEHVYWQVTVPAVETAWHGCGDCIRDQIGAEAMDKARKGQA